MSDPIWYPPSTFDEQNRYQWERKLIFFFFFFFSFFSPSAGVDKKDYFKNKNGYDDFFPIDVEWNEHPDRDEKYRTSMIKKIGLERWAQEYECVAGNTKVIVRDKNTGLVKEIRIEELYEIIS